MRTSNFHGYFWIGYNSNEYYSINAVSWPDRAHQEFQMFFFFSFVTGCKIRWNDQSSEQNLLRPYSIYSSCRVRGELFCVGGGAEVSHRFGGSISCFCRQSDASVADGAALLSRPVALRTSANTPYSPAQRLHPLRKIMKNKACIRNTDSWPLSRTFLLRCQVTD